MKNSLGRNILTLTSTKFVNLAIGMVSMMLLSRYISLEEYGTYSQLTLIVTLGVTLFVMGLPNSLNYFMAKLNEKQEKVDFVSTYFTVITILGLVSGVILISVLPIISSYFSNDLLKSFAPYLLAMPLITMMSSSIGNLLVVYERVQLLSAYNIASSVIILSSLIISILMKISFINYMYIVLGAQIIITSVLYFIVYKISGGLNIKIDKHLMKKIMSFSLPLGISMIVGTLTIELDKLMVGYFFDTETLAIYTNAAKEMPITIIATSVTAILLPKIVRMLSVGKEKESLELWGESIIFVYIFICFFTMVLFVFAPEIITILYSEKYISGIPVFRVYTIVLLFRVTYFSIILNAMGKTTFILYSSLFSLFLNVILNFIFLSIWGLIGLALATVISIALVAIIQLLATSKILEIKMKKIFPWNSIFILTIINIILAFFMNSINRFLIEFIEANSIYTFIIVSIIWSVLYLLIVLKSLKKSWANINSY